MASPIEIWKPVIGAEELYEVSSLGRVRSLDRPIPNPRGNGFRIKLGRVLRTAPDPRGYLRVTLCIYTERHTIKVHRLVAIHFLSPSSLPEVNHIDLDKHNNNASNLEWSTHGDNMNHAKAAGLYNPYSNPRRAKKLDPKVVEDIRKARADGMTYRAIGLKFRIAHVTAQHIVKGTRWNQIYE